MTGLSFDLANELATELALMADADKRAAHYTSGTQERRVYPDTPSLAALVGFEEVLPDVGLPADSTIALLDGLGSPATVASNGPRYFGFVVGASLPVASAAERLMLAWDQGAPLAMASPVSAAVEAVAARWMVDILDLPRGSVVGFGTSASTCSLSLLAAARRTLLLRKGWDLDRDGLFGAPEVKVVVPAKVHVTILKALRILGFGASRLLLAPCDVEGRVIPKQLPPLDDMTILVLQAGEVNTGEFDPFDAIIPAAKAAGAWVHIDGAFGLWARASTQARNLTQGVEQADSWTIDGHKWLNTPYDCAMAICRHTDALAGAMNSDAAYASGSAAAQKNLTLEFSRRARGIPVWAALRTLGRAGVEALVDHHRSQAAHLAARLRKGGFEVLNRVVLNQVLVRAANDAETNRIREAATQTGEVWFGPSVWEGRAAFRLSLSSWRTTDADVDRLADILLSLLAEGDEA